jgi:hypothetical protein
MNAMMNPMLGQARPAACVLLIGALLACGTARADAEEAALTQVGAALASDPENAVATLKAGKAAQERRFAARMHRLEPDTQMRLNGHTSDAQALRERGNAARHVRHDPRMRQAFDERLHARAGSRSHVTGAARAPHGLDFDAPRRSPAARVSADAAPSRTARGPLRPGSVARGVARGMAVGWASETALGMHVPDAFDAVKWSAGTLQRPQDTPKRFAQLATGAVHFTGKVATRLTRPDRMAVSLVDGGADLVKTGARVVRHPHQVVGGVGKAAKSVVRFAGNPAPALSKVGCGVDKLFNPRKKC